VTEPVTTDLPVPSVALAVAAHPDDVEFGCGATLAKWAARGCTIHHLILTDGSKGTWDADGNVDALVATRRDEQRRAAEALGGGDVTFLNLVDGELQAGLAERREVCAVIRRVRPDVVLGHDPWRRYRLHPDHRNAGWLLTDGVVAARDPKFFTSLDLAPHRPSTMLLWEADEPNHVESATGFVDAKLAALLEHRSQYRSTMAIDDERSQGQVEDFRAKVEARLAEAGARAGIDSGEAFHLIPEL
jgi:LmbE family N-acetylglucosaminyl deacetylase